MKKKIVLIISVVLICIVILYIVAQNIAKELTHEQAESAQGGLF